MRRALAAAAVAVLALTAVVGLSARPTGASWADREFAQATLTSGTLLGASGLRCSPSGGLLSGGVPLVWTAPTGTATGVVPTYYRLVAQPLLGGSTSQDTTTPGQTSLTMPGGLLTLLGTYTLTVYGMDAGKHWLSPASNSVTVTIISVLGITSYACSS